MLSLVSFYVSAHSGGTDANGGHYQGSSYHYHHGYPAHQHTNGECPYDFVDNTKGNSGSTKTEKEYVYITKEVESSASKFYTIGFYFVLFIGFILAYSSLKAHRSKYIEIFNVREIHRKEIESLKDSYNVKIYALEEQIVRHNLEKNEIALLEAYTDSPFYEEAKPKKELVLNKKDNAFRIKNEDGSFFELSEVYIASRSAGRFHVKDGCCGAYIQASLQDVMYEKTPCSKCCSRSYIEKIYKPFKTWHEEYERSESLKRRNINVIKNNK